MSTTVLPVPTSVSLSVRERERERGPGRWQRLTRGSDSDAAWVRPALLLLLALTAVAYVWDLKASGDANSFYAAAVQAGTKSWKAFFFGSIDSSNFITVDKIPGSLWIMELSGRIFGFSSLSMLIPQVLEGLVAITLLYGTVRRWFGAGAGLLAGSLLAITPVAALMFRFNNPDALLVCLLVAGAYCLTRALERASTRWIVAAGTVIGFAFLAKMMQAFLVLPAFGLVYIVAAPTGLRRRAAQLLTGSIAIVLSAGWWVAIVALWPASSRPMIDGSSDNSIINLILGYNGLGRIFGASGGGTNAGGGGSFSGAAGAFRLFNDLMGGQASWLLPAALMVLLGGLALTWRAPRTDRTRAALLLWGGWLVVSGVVFSYSTGIIHTYYTVALTPAICALVAIGTSAVWRTRDQLAAKGVMATGVAVTAAWAVVLLQRSSSWLPWLSYLTIASAVLSIAGLLLTARWHGATRRLWGLIAVSAAVACLAGPFAYTAQAISTAHTGTTPSAGPSSAAMSMGGASPTRTGRSGSTTGGGPGATGSQSHRIGASPSASAVGSSGARRSGAPSLAGGSAIKGGPASSTGGDASSAEAASSTASDGSTHSASGPTTSAGSGGGGAGEMSVSKSLARLLQDQASHYRWVAATSGSESAASLELATNGDPVMAIGGFNGQGGNLSLAAFKAYVAKGEIHYYIASSSSQMGGTATSTLTGASSIAKGGSLRAGNTSRTSRARTSSGPGGQSSADSILTWVKAHYKSTTIDGVTVYNLTEAN